MSELQNIVIHGDGRDLEIQLFSKEVYIHVEWKVDGGVRAESFEMAPETALRLAHDLIDRYEA